MNKYKNQNVSVHFLLTRKFLPETAINRYDQKELKIEHIEQKSLDPIYPVVLSK